MLPYSHCFGSLAGFILTQDGLGLLSAADMMQRLTEMGPRLTTSWVNMAVGETAAKIGNDY